MGIDQVRLKFLPSGTPRFVTMVCIYPLEHGVQIFNEPGRDAAQALLPLKAVAYALLSAQGQVIVANAGFCRLCCDGTDAAPDPAAVVGRDVAVIFVGPSFNDISAGSAEPGALLYGGLLSVLTAQGQAVSLSGTFHRRGSNIELLAEHNIEEHVQLLTSVLALNAELAQTQRDLARSNRAQATLLAKLEAAQSQMLQIEKLASIGQLAAGVAHEINNPIAFVSSNLNTLAEYLQDLWAVLDAYAGATPLIARDAQALGTIERICQERDIAFVREDSVELLAQSRDGLLRVKAIVQNLKDFSRVDQSQWQVANLHDGLDSTLNLVAAQLRAKAEVVRDYGDLPALLCAPGQLNQVFVNLLVNAAQAIEHHGVITVRTGRGDDGLDPDQWGWVEVQDTGCGIAQHQMHRLFEPFYTTKIIGQGTGLGLSLCYGIVQSHGGRIEVHSQPGQGARFRVVLPLHGVGPKVTENRQSGV